MYENKENIIDTIQANTGMHVTGEELDAVLQLFKLTSISLAKQAESPEDQGKPAFDECPPKKGKAFIEILEKRGKPNSTDRITSIIIALRENHHRSN